MAEIKAFVLNELSGWKVWEVTWLIVTCTVITGLSIYWGDSAIGIISATTGVACVVFTGKGKLSAYIFGVVNTLLYALIAYQAKYYGEVMLNTLYYFPLQFYGFYVWSKHMNSKTREVKKRHMTRKNLVTMLLVTATATCVYGYILQRMGGNLPYVDSLSTVVSVVAMLVSIRMYAEQWILWIIVNVVTIVMWGYVFFIQGSESVATLMMWVVYLCNAVIMYIKWDRESRLTVEQN